jgi:phytoene desaturase
MKHDYDVVIVGAGLGGLASGSLLAQKGKRVLVLDRHNRPGGYATNFERNGFTFDASLHSFDGATPGSHSFKCIEACGIADKVEFIAHRNLYRLISGDIDLTVEHRNPEGYRRQLASHFPSERTNIDRLFAEAERMYEETAAFMMSDRPFWMRVLATPFKYRRLLRYEKETVYEFFSRFTANDRLKDVLAAQWTYYGLPPRDLAFPYFSYPFVDYLTAGGYSIKGGSQKLSDALTEVIEDHGGRVMLSSPVTQIRVANNRVRGVVTRKLDEVNAPVVISNVSPQAVVGLAGTDRFSSRFRSKLQAMKLSTSGFQVYLGLDCPLQELGVREDEYIVFHSHTHDLSAQYRQMMQGTICPDQTSWSINYFSNVDPSMAPPGKSTLGIFSLISGEEWQRLSKAEYRRRKELLTSQLIAQAEERLPGLAGHIEVQESGSPRTMAKFTGNPGGSMYGFEQTVSQSGLFHRFPQRYPVKGLYQVGAWTFPGGGFIGAMLSARVLVDRYFRHAN